MASSKWQVANDSTWHIAVGVVVGMVVVVVVIVEAATAAAVV